MHKVRLLMGVTALSAAVATSALAQQSAHRSDVAAGLQFASHNCDACHIVSTNQDVQPLVGGYAPSFSAIANRPNTSPDTLRLFLNHPHGYSNMPYPDLSASDLSNVIAYIMSLRGAR
jgi:mono/diheme cytochrome c family protein